MISLYQYCDYCNTERNFNPETLKCITCGHINSSQKMILYDKGNKQNSRGT
jgi:hypothetical protein